MLLDVLAVIIGFSAVMVLLSLIVTAMVQATQSLFRMRSANLRDGLEMVIGQVAGTNSNAGAAARAVLEAASMPPAKSVPGRLVDFLAPRERTWIDPDEVGEHLREAAAGFTDAEVEDTARRFRRAEQLMTMRFVGRIRVVTLLWALVVPLWFQVDSLALLSNLSLQPELRALADQRHLVMSEYENLLDELRLAAVRESTARAGSAARYLGALNLSPWWGGWSFYASLANWLGVLITTLALMLGAPFWFNVLKSTVGLRDTLKPVKREEETGTS